ncbi:MAG: phosphatase PAP2 family protein [Actinobacteria bacterium]|nr:MAG: phosphatase PAP2 family protein [Actinomycetota bacterium]
MVPRAAGVPRPPFPAARGTRAGADGGTRRRDADRHRLREGGARRLATTEPVPSRPAAPRFPDAPHRRRRHDRDEGGHGLRQHAVHHDRRGADRARVHLEAVVGARATIGAAFYCAAALVLARATRSWQWKVIIWTVAVTFVGMIGFSRLYLRVHWLTDVLGGAALGTMWTIVVASGLGVWHRAREKASVRRA